MKRIAAILVGLCLLGTQVWAAKVGLGVGVSSRSIHPQFPIENQDESMQTNLGFKIKTREEVFSTLFSGGVDLVGNIDYDGEGSSQNLLISNLLQRSFPEMGVEMENYLQIAGEENAGLEELSTKLRLSRILTPAVEGSVIGGYNYNHLDRSHFLMGLGLSTEAMSCTIDVDLWASENPTLVGKISKEVNVYRFTLGALTNANTQNSKVWLEFKMSVNDLSDISRY